MRTVALVFLAACGGGAPHAVGNTTTAPAHGATPHAPMFELGHSWRYHLTGANGAADVTCKVADGGALVEGGVWSTISCDSDDAKYLPGTWIENGSGLYHDTDAPVDGKTPKLAAWNLVLADPPVAGARPIPLDGGEDEGGSDTVTVRQDGDHWCVDDDNSGMDGAEHSSACFDRDGLVSYHDDSHGAGGDDDEPSHLAMERAP